MALGVWPWEYDGESMVGESVMVGEPWRREHMGARLGNPLKSPWQTCELHAVNPNPLPSRHFDKPTLGMDGADLALPPMQIWCRPGPGKVNGFDSIGQIDSTPCQAGSTSFSGAWQVDATCFSLGIWVRESLSERACPRESLSERESLS
jgi:hypothetical protein